MLHIIMRKNLQHYNVSTFIRHNLYGHCFSICQFLAKKQINTQEIKQSSALTQPRMFGIACYTGSSSIVPELYYLPMISTIGKKELWLICYSLHFQTKALHVRLSPDRASFYLLVQNHEKLISIHLQRIYDEQHGQMKTTHPLVFYISILF